MIVPLSLSFSSDFDDLRQMLYRSYSGNWFSHFARIPAALFAADVRVRNTIHIGRIGGENQKPLTSRLHRWFEAARPHLFSALSYSRFDPTPWSGRIPKLNSDRLIEAFEKLFNTRGAVEGSLRKRGLPVYFKKTAYNWLAFSLVPPPCFTANWKPISDSNSGVVYFDDEHRRSLALALLNGKIELSFWIALGDDLNFPKWAFSQLPVNLGKAFKEEAQLLSICDDLKTAIDEAIVYKLNAGKQVGSFNLAKCRHITDKSDALFARAFGLEDVWSDIELLYVQTIKTDFESDGVDE